MNDDTTSGSGESQLRVLVYILRNIAGDAIHALGAFAAELWREKFKVIATVSVPTLWTLLIVWIHESYTPSGYWTGMLLVVLVFGWLVWLILYAEVMDRWEQAAETVSQSDGDSG